MLVASFHAWDEQETELGNRFWNTALLDDKSMWQSKAIEVTNVEAPWKVSVAIS